MRVDHDQLTIARRGLKVKVMGQANAVGLTSIEGSFILVARTMDVDNILRASRCQARFVTYACLCDVQLCHWCHKLR